SKAPSRAAPAHSPKGNGFTDEPWVQGIWDSTFLPRVWSVGDVNGDRRADLIATDTANTVTVADVLESTGTSFTPRSWGSWPNNTGKSGLAGDYSGDGKTDVAMLVKSNGQWWPNNVLTAAGAYPDLVTGIDNPLGGPHHARLQGVLGLDQHQPAFHPADRLRPHPQ